MVQVLLGGAAKFLQKSLTHSCRHSAYCQQAQNIWNLLRTGLPMMAQSCSPPQKTTFQNKPALNKKKILKNDPISWELCWNDTTRKDDTTRITIDLKRVFIFSYLEIRN